jgi:hypothetical protein
MPSKVEEITNRSMRGHESLSLPSRFEPPHHSLPHSRRLVRLLSPVVGILRIIVDNIWHQLPVSYTITSQLIRHDLPGLAAVVPYQSLEESFSRCTIPPSLKMHINPLAILVNSTPKIMLLANDLHENFIDEEGITVVSMLSL